MKNAAKFISAVALFGLMAVSAWADLNDGLVAYYPFDGNAQDATTNGHHGKEQGNLNYVAGKIGQAAQFDGVNDYIDSPVNFNGAKTSFSISYWLKVDSLRGKVFHFQEDVSGLPEITNDFQGDKLNFYLRGTTNGERDDARDGITLFSEQIETNQWYHLVSVFDFKNPQKTTIPPFLSSAKGFQVVSNKHTKKGYINGKLVLETTSQLPINRLPNSPLRIGASLNDTEYLNGIVDEFRLYDRVLSEAEIQTLYTVKDKSRPSSRCEHASYSRNKKTLTVPFIEISVIDFISGQPTGEVEIFKGVWKQVGGTKNRFRLLYKTVRKVTEGSRSSSCPATYSHDKGALHIPYVDDVPTGVDIGNKDFEGEVKVFETTLVWEPIGRSFVVQDIQKLSAEVKDESSPTSPPCEHASYSRKKRTLTVPFIEISVIDFISGQPTGEVEILKGVWKQVGTQNRFRLLYKTVSKVTDGSRSSSCPATYSPDKGALHIPYVDNVPTGVSIGRKNFKGEVKVFETTLVWEPIGRSFVVQDIQKLSAE